MARKFHTFAELFAKEHCQIGDALGADGAVLENPDTYIDHAQSSGEPWVKTAPTDRVGLALSGGGIRSAIFNLGLLEALDQREILPLVDYLSTVSGGGYIGGFWTAWRTRVNDVTSDSAFPHHSSTDEPAPGEPISGERPEIRHLREFSRYLVPRIGLNESEMWFALATICGGMLPALLATMAVVALGFYAWLGVGYLALASQNGGMTVFVVLNLVFHLVSRKEWLDDRREENMSRGDGKWRALYWMGVLVTTAIGAGLVRYFTGCLGSGNHWGWPASGPRQNGRFITFGFEPALAWLTLAFVVACGWIFLEALWRALELSAEIRRTANSRKAGQPDEELQKERDKARRKFRERRLRRGTVRDQLSSRYLMWAVVAASLAGLWDASFRIADAASAASGLPAVLPAGGLTAVFTGIYIWLRDWLAKPDKQSEYGSLWRKFLQRGQALLPMLSASAGALCLVIFTVLLLRYYGLGSGGGHRVEGSLLRETWKAIGIGAGLAGGSVVIALKIFDPAHFGLHDFYRSRIARAFLGAAFVPGSNWTGQQRDDDTTLTNIDQVAAACQRDEVAARDAAAHEGIADAKGKALNATAHALRRQREYLTDLADRKRQERTTHPAASDNRYTVERLEDDVCLTDLRARWSSDMMLPVPEDASQEARKLLELRLRRLRLRPVHLICCAANHLTGDALSTLSRGARSAVLSQRGVSLGNDTCAPRTHEPEMMLSAAQTASGAAFNSQMGEKSLRLGPASSFLMSALNLRLGLWVVNPSAERIESDRLVYDGLCLRRMKADLLKDGGKLRHPWLFARYWLWTAFFHIRRNTHESAWWHLCFDLPGSAFFLELFGRSSTTPADRFRRLHLSDGGHFENLGLYELVRRHTRYIIVSDAGQDEEIAFDDLGNAIRRVREDFGVEIEIDLAPIRPDARLESRQHLVVGTVHYDGFEGCDKGTLLYIKPTLTGDEPGDIQQYRSRNRIFPHEPTSNQFFTEAQWESYRRLGEHIGQNTFGFLDFMSDAQRRRPETVFRQMRSVWSPLPPELRAALDETAVRFSEFDADFAKSIPATLRAEFWPEVAAVCAPMTTTPPNATAAAADAEAEMAVVLSLMRLLQLMEKAWMNLRLDEFSNHPATAGVMNRLQRWWATPSLRRWWVPLSPLFSNAFREFVKINFNLRARDVVARGTDVDRTGPKLELRRAASRAAIENGIAWKQYQQRSPTIPADAHFFEYFLVLQESAPYWSLQVGIAIMEFKTASEERQSGKIAHWMGGNLFVPASLSGAGMSSRFLDRMIKEMKDEGVERIHVTLQDEFHRRRDQAAREARVDHIGFYKSRGFVIHPSEDDMILAEMYLDLGASPATG